MLNKDVILYLCSRVISAAGAFAAVTIFTRMAGASEYGRYLLIFAWGMIVFAFTSQWMIGAFFGIYASKRLPEYMASLFHLVLPALAIAAIGLIGAQWLGFHDAAFVAAVFAMVVGMTMYFSAFDAARMALKSKIASLSMILRVALMVAFGIFALAKGGGAAGLAVAIMAAHLIAAIPCWIAIGGIDRAKQSPDASRHIVRFGLPLMLSFGALALGQNIDRVIVAQYLGVSALGPYGAVSEMMRQSFAVFGEAILFSMITTAKQHSNDGSPEASKRMLRIAFNACMATGTFGAAFFIVFGDRVVQLALGPEFHGPVADLIPIFAIAYAFMMLGQYYFANVIYFTNASYLAAVFSVTLVLISGTLSYLLVPLYGAKGAAIALLSGYLASCLVLIVAGRRHYSMPVDLAGLAGISSLAVIFVSVAWLLTRVEANASLLAISQITVLLALAAFAVHRYDLLQTISGDLEIDRKKPQSTRHSSTASTRPAASSTRQAA
jgi:O-antigen/teichoic acid export membrane protein